MVAVSASNLAEALVAAQADMPAVAPDAVNPHFRSKFVSLDHLIAMTRPVLNRHGLAIRQSPTHIDGQPALETTIHHVSGEEASSVMPLLVSKSDMQGLGGAITYARRYAWAAALGICADEDDDGNQASAGGGAAAPERAVGTARQGSDNHQGGVEAASPASAAHAPSTDGPFTWPSGKHQGKTFADTPPDYLDWYADNGPRPEVRAAIELYQGEQLALAAMAAEEDIPF